jgi:hypothetical protein
MSNYQGKDSSLLEHDSALTGKLLPTLRDVDKMYQLYVLLAVHRSITV